MPSNADDFQEQVHHSLQGFEIRKERENVFMILIAHEQNIICSKTIICKQLFAGHVVGSRPMKRKEKIHRMINNIIVIRVSRD